MHAMAHTPQVPQLSHGLHFANIASPSVALPIPGISGFVDQLRLMEECINQMEVRLAAASSLSAQYSQLQAAHDAQINIIASIQHELVQLEKGQQVHQHQHHDSSNIMKNTVENVPTVESGHEDVTHVNWR
jgi:predicted  nucleic acid-binding Zn-ribbon protein